MNYPNISKEQLLAELAELQQRVAGLEEQLAQSKQVEAAQLASESEQRRQRDFLECLIANAGACIAVVKGRELRYTLANPAFEAFAGGVPLVGRTYREAFPEAADAGAEARLRQVLETGETWNVESYRASVPGIPYAKWQGHVVRLPSVADEEPSALAVFWDVTDRNQAEENLRRVNRAIRARTECDRALVRATQENEFIEQVCRILVELGGYRMVWVGYAEHDDARTVRPVAQTGAVAEYLDSAQVTWADSERGRGPAGVCIRTRKPAISHNIATDPSMVPWRDAALRQGFASVAALPLLNCDEVMGVLVVYAETPDCFDPAEIDLLTDLAGDLSFGVATLRTRAARAVAEATLRDERRRLADIIEADHAGTWEWNVQTGETIFNERWAEIVGYTLAELAPISVETWIRLAHPDDLRTSGAMLEKHFRGELDYYDLQARMQHKDGSWVWVRDRGKVITWTDEGKPLWMRGTHHDITHQMDTEAALRASESRFRAYVDQAADALFVHDFSGRLVDVNPQACASLGYSREEMLCLNLCDVETKFDLSQMQAAWLQLIPGEASTLTGRHRRKDGSTFPIEVRVGCFDLEGQRYYLGLVRNITRREQRAVELLHANERLELAKQAAGQGVWDWDIPAGQLNWSPEMFRLFGLDQEVHVASFAAWDAAMHPEDRVAAYESIERSLRDHTLFDTEYRVVHPDGQVRWIGALGKAVYDDAGRGLRMTGVCMDVTERRAMVEKIRQWNADLEHTVTERTAELTAEQARTVRALELVAASESRFRAIFEEAPLGVALVDSLTGKIHEVNPRFAAIAGRTREDMATIDWMSITHPDDLQPDLDNMARLNAGEIAGFQMNKRYIRPDGSLVWINMTIAPVTVEAGDSPRHLCMIEDITQRKEADDRLRSITDAAHDAILMMDSRGAISYWNPAAERILGFSAEETIGRNLHELLAPERYHADYRRAFPEFVLSGRGKAVGKTLDMFARRRDGREISVSLSLSAVHLSGEWHAVGVLTDITERKQAEERLYDALQRLQLATAAGSIGTWSWSFGDNKLEWDDRLCDWYGVPEADRRAGLYYEFWRARVHPDDRDRSETLLQDSCRDGVAAEDKFRIILPDGRMRYIHSAWTFERDSDGNLVRTIGVNRDITQQHELEEELLAAKQVADAASAAKSAFLANMSHEIRTPMNGVIGMTGLLLDTELNSQQRRYAETIRSSGESLLTLINDILDFSKIEAGKLELETLEFDLHTALDEFVSPLALRAQGKGIELICAVAPDVPSWLVGDSGRLRQILTNLVGNAVKFTEQGEISARASLVAETESDVLIRFVIRDTGIGLTPEQQQSLFQKFTQADASTSRRFGGTGLGLTIAKQLAELMGGEIGMTSEAGVGSEFWFTARLGKSSQRPAPAPPPANLRGTHVLVVDDSATNREILLAQLVAWGIEAEAVADGSAALQSLARARDEHRPFRAALIDMRMPGMDGNSLAHAIREDVNFGTTRLILLTSLGRQGNAADLAQRGFAACLTKPIRQADLLDCLARVLTERFATQQVVIRSELATVPALRRTTARILVAEDNIVNQEVALAILRKLGLQANAVENGEEAIEALRVEHYDLVLMDVEMPEIDGLEATRLIRDPKSNVHNHQIPIVAMTAAAMQGDRERCLEAGMNGYISKPVSPRALVEALNAWLPGEIG